MSTINATTDFASRRLPRGIEVPFGTIVRAQSYAPALRPGGLSPNMPVVQGTFPAAGFATEQELPVFCDVRLIELAPNCPPVMMFVLQVGPAVVHWFADMSDEEMLDLLAEWDQYGTMALAAKLDDGRVLFGVKDYSLVPEVHRFLREGASLHREEMKAAFPRTMATVQAVEGIKNIATSGLPNYPVVQTAYMSTVRTSETNAVVVALESIPVVKKYLLGGLDSLLLELDAVRRAGYHLAPQR